MIVPALLLAIANPAPAASSAPAVDKSRPPKPANAPTGWVLFSDYPPNAAAEHREGKVTFKVIVAPDGYVIGCDVTRSSGSDELDNTTCAMVTQRAMFTPALDANGKAVTDTYVNSVVWDLPDPVPPVAPAKPAQ